MNLVPKEILMSHLQRSEGAEEVSLPIDFFRDLLYQAMPRTWAGLTDDERLFILFTAPPTFMNHKDDVRETAYTFAEAVQKLTEKKLKEKNNA